MNGLIRKRGYLLTCALLVVSAAINVYFAFVLQMIIDSTVSGEVAVLLKAIGFAILFMLFDMLVTIASKYVSGKQIQSILREMKSRKFHSLLTSFGGKEERAEESYIASFSTDIEIIEHNYLQSRLNMVFYTAQFIFGLAAIISISYMVTIGIAAATLLPVLIPKAFQGLVRRRKEQYSRKAGEYLANVAESFEGRHEIRDYDKVDVFMGKHDLANRQIEEARFKSRFIDNAVETIAQNLGFLTFIAALGIGSYYVLKGDMTFGYMIAVVQLMNNLLQPLNYITTSLNQINSSKNIAAGYGETAAAVSPGNPVPDFHDHIAVTGLSFSYDEAAPVIRDMTLSFEKGKKYAIIGPSGCGKSTLAKILAGDLKGYEGLVQLDGQDIGELQERDYRNLVRYVRQETYIFADTIRSNILFYDDSFDEEQLRRSVQLAKVADFASSQEELDKTVSNTEGLSGGQKQRVSLARALLRNAPVLILDEVTSSVDPVAAYDIYRNLVNRYDGTCIVITHQQDEEILDLFDQVIEFPSSAAAAAAITGKEVLSL